MDQEKVYKGSCFCGAVQFTVTGEPVAMGYCHCESCRSWMKDFPAEMGGSGVSVTE